MRTLAVIWRSAGLLMAIDARAVVEVLPPISCRPMPGTPGWVRGLFPYRGTLIPLVDATRLLGATPDSDRMANRVIVIKVTAGSVPIAWPVGLWVDSVLEIERTDFAATGGHPGFATDTTRFLGPVAQTHRGQVQLVDPAELFTPEQVAIMTERLTEGAA